jgi:glycosyltransferase involved in cell wall biosynthesis
MASDPESAHRNAVCIIVENETVPYDRRVWMEACTLKRAGYALSVICPKRSSSQKNQEVVDGIEIYRYWSWNSQGIVGHIFEYGWSLLAEFVLALKVYARRRFRVLHACNPPDTIFLIGLFFKLFGVRFVFDHHDLSPELYLARFGQNAERGLIYWFVCAAERRTFRTADLSIATNESYREIAITRGEMKPEHVAVVQTCPDLREVDSVEGIPRARGDQPYLVAYVGGMEPQDGVDLLLQSAEYIVKEKRRDDIRFIAIGSGSEVPRLQALASQMLPNGNFEFTGRVDHRKVYDYLSVADVCVAPDPLNSLNDRCSMIKIFEYMAHGKPTVLFDLKEGRRSAGDSALYARPNDPADFGEQILKLLDSESLRQKLGQCGRKRAEETLNLEVQSKKLLDAYAALLNR